MPALSACAIMRVCARTLAHACEHLAMTIAGNHYLPLFTVYYCCFTTHTHTGVAHPIGEHLAITVVGNHEHHHPRRVNI